MLCVKLCGGSIKYTGVGKFEACYVKKGAELACYYTLTQPWLGVFSPCGGGGWCPGGGGGGAANSKLSTNV